MKGEAMEEQACVVSQRHLELFAPFGEHKENNACNLQPLPPSTFRSAWSCSQHVQTLKKTQPATEQESHGTFDLHLQVYIILLLSSGSHSSLISCPPLHPCSPSHHLHIPISDPFELPQYPHSPSGCRV